MQLIEIGSFGARAAIRAPAVFAFCISLIAPLASGAESFTDERQMGLKYSSLAQINATNVKDLELAWEYHTGEMTVVKDSLDAFEDEPSLVEGSLIVCTTSRRLIALDPATGKQRWVYDPKTKPVGMKKCRGISAWTDAAAPAGSMCKTRILLGTADYRLDALDVKTGKLCPNFGNGGKIQLPVSKPETMNGEVSAGSRPAVVNGVVVVGSTVADDQRLEAPSGRVLAYDARSGKKLWEFDPIPRTASDPAVKTWLNGLPIPHGAANVWSEMSVDESLDLVYLPTSSPSADFFGGQRPGNNAYADSVVALKGKTGEVAWYFQFVHHNIWDYDTPSQPLLMDLPHNGKMVPALIQNTKMGLIYVFDRRTGEPLVPIEERPVPQQYAVPGEWLSPTQPFPVGMPVVAPQGITPDDAWGFTPIDRWMCKKRIAELNYGPIYTPPSLKGTVFMPSVAGGPNWGGAGYDPKSHIMVVPSARIATIVTLVPRADVTIDPNQAIVLGKPMLFPEAGTPYIAKIEPLLSPLKAPCNAPPWATLSAVDIVNKKKLWEVPLGGIDNMVHMHIPWEPGTPGAGGPLVTGGGLAFIGYALDNYFRAFDLKTGETLWKEPLPTAGMATPMSYEVNGEQYVVLTAGGHSLYGTKKGDSVVAFKLKR